MLTDIRFMSSIVERILIKKSVNLVRSGQVTKYAIKKIKKRKIFRGAKQKCVSEEYLFFFLLK